MDTRRALIKRLCPHMSLRHKCQLLDVHKSTLLYKAEPKPEDEVTLMNMIQDIYAESPFLGYRRITVFLRKEGICINKKRVLRLIQLMGIMAVYPKKNLSKRRMEDKVYPYLLKDQPPLKPNDAWSVDITYIKLGTGFVYLTCLIDIVSRRIMGWDLSTHLEATSALSALEMGLAKDHRPKMINSDQGCQFTSSAWTEKLLDQNILISMDGKGRCIDNIFIERFWRSIKYEEVYLKAYDSVRSARQEIGAYIDWYNHHRPHQSLGYKTPHEVFCAKGPMKSWDNSTSYPHLPTGGPTAAVINLCA